jgi:hypothetical protein
MFGRSSTNLIEMTEDTLGAVAQYRGYRDTVVHSRIIDATLGIAEMTFRRDRIEEVIIT